MLRRVCISACVLLSALAGAAADPSFVNWENPHVHPLDLTPDAGFLLAVNTADNRLEVFDVSSGRPLAWGDVFVGLDPVAVRARDNAQAWVVNHISDSVSVVDLPSLRVIATLRTDDEPTDVVFAGSPQRAFVSCSQANTILVFDPADLAAPPTRIEIDAEDPRALAVSADGSKVYAAVFESGNNTTILGGGSTIASTFPPNAVSDVNGPYGGVNPPPNDGANFKPPQRPGNPAPPKVSLIVRKDIDPNSPNFNKWMDDNNRDWTSMVSGPNAFRSGRRTGWDLLDHDLAIIDAQALTVTYAKGLMNLCMSLAVNPATDEITVIGTDATNEVRYEPVLQARFLRVLMARVNAGPLPAAQINDLNPHLTYGTGVPFMPIPQSERNKSLGDPRGIVWNSAGDTGYVCGMGSNNLIVIDSNGNRILPNPIDVGEGPTGLALDESRDRLYVLNRFAASISVIDTSTHSELLPRVPLFDPTPHEIKIGRKHLYDTHRTSGLGHIACASCHVDARTDRLAWDLGNPAGTMKTFNQNCVAGTCLDWHPMKGPMTTQTLQDIIFKEPLHWRGDRTSIEEFADAFHGLQGADDPLPPAEMAEFRAFLATIHLPPNPYRNFDNSLPDDLPLPGHYTSGLLTPPGEPLPNGNARHALDLFDEFLPVGLGCIKCHQLPIGTGTNLVQPPATQAPIPPSLFGENHLGVAGTDGFTNVSIKIPQIRNLYEKTGFDLTQLRNRSGFGFFHDGSVDSLSRFFSDRFIGVTDEQQVADLIAFILAFSGSDFGAAPLEPEALPQNPMPVVTSLDTHAAVGRQTTLRDADDPDPGQLDLIADMTAEADKRKVGLIVKGIVAGETRGYLYRARSGVFQSDRATETVAAPDLMALAAPGGELTYTVVPVQSIVRLGVDRDADGFYDRDELDACSDPANPLVVPGMHAADLTADFVADFDDVLTMIDVLLELDPNPLHRQRADLNCDGFRNADDLQPFIDALLTP